MRLRSVTDLHPAPARRVMSLQEPFLKMSKSHEDHRSRILLTDTPEEIGAKVRLALTDSIKGVSFDELRRPGVSNLLAIAASLDLQERSIDDLAQSCEGLGMFEFKNQMTSTISNGLKVVREKYDHVMKIDNGRYLKDVAIEGAKKAQKKAEIIMNKVRNVIGIKN